MLNPCADLPLRESDGKLDVGGLIGKGFLSVIMDLGLKEPYTGSVPLVSGEIAEDFSYYYAVSKQVPAAISLGVLIGRDLSVLKAGGFMLQLLPGAPESLITEMEKRISEMPSVTTLLRDGASITEILEDITRGYDPGFPLKFPAPIPATVPGSGWRRRLPVSAKKNCAVFWRKTTAQNSAAIFVI